MRPIDLHAHTTVSDGTLPPAELVALAARVGLAAVAVTDHDHVAGLPEARRAGAREGVEVVAGIELSAAHPAGALHLLGYLLDPGHEGLLRTLDRLRDARGRRAARMVERLQALGVGLTLEDVAAEAAPGSALGRPHVARALVRGGHAASVQGAFDAWLGDGRPAHVPKEALSARRCVDLIHDAGGLAVWAHPVTIPAGRREGLLRELVQAGLDGIEVIHSKQDVSLREELSAWARREGLLETGGSDFHGENKPDVALGTGRDGNVAVPYGVLEALKGRAIHPPG